MSNVNRNPAGALELLNLNLQGEFPRLLAGSLSPVLDMERYYLDGVGLRSQRVLAPNVTVIGDGPSVLIPINETWAIRSVSVNALNQDVSTQVSISIIANPGRLDGPEYSLTPTFTSTTLTNQYYRNGSVFQAPLLLPPQTSIRSVMSILGGAPVFGMATFLDVFYYPLTLG